MHWLHVQYTEFSLQKSKTSTRLWCGRFELPFSEGATSVYNFRMLLRISTTNRNDIFPMQGHGRFTFVDICLQEASYSATQSRDQIVSISQCSHMPCFYSRVRKVDWRQLGSMPLIPNTLQVLLMRSPARASKVFSWAISSIIGLAIRPSHPSLSISSSNWEEGAAEMVAFPVFRET